MASTINAQTTPFAAVIMEGDSTGTLALQTANVTALTIDSSQVVSLTQPLPVSSGGTGATTQAAAAAAVLPSQTGNTGKYLTTDGSNTSWSTVTQTRISGGTTGLTPNTLTSGDVTLAGVLAVANGGTGTSTPSLVGGTNITISGTWPNQTVTAAGGGVTSLNGQTGAISNTDFGVIGSYGLFMYAANSSPGAGGVVAGSSLRYGYSMNSSGSTIYQAEFTGYITTSSSYAAGGSSVSGTWKKMSGSQTYGSGPYGKGTGYKWAATLWVRVS